MGSLNLMLNAQPAVLRDMKVSLVNTVTSEKREVTPFLDGTVQVANIEAGNWQVIAKHPNLIFDVINKPIRILPDRPTITRIPIPANIFSNAAIADTPDANLGPVQAKLAESETSARDQARKVAGQPIFADDWNALAATLGDTAKATGELATLVSPIGHDHPELVSKLSEIQGNLQTFYDLFARSLAELQRQIEQLALQRKVEAVAERVPTLPQAARDRMFLAVDELTKAYQDPPSVYNLKKRNAGTVMQEELEQALLGVNLDGDAQSAVTDFRNVTGALSSGSATPDYGAELKQRQRAENASNSGMFIDAMRAVKTRTF
jgi:hypothetical protein